MTIILFALHQRFVSLSKQAKPWTFADDTNLTSTASANSLTDLEADWLKTNDKKYLCFSSK